MKAIVIVFAIFHGANAMAGEWTRLPPLPDKGGFAGAFAGVSNGALLVAGGTNFPDKKPWDGGKKVWYDTVFALDKHVGAWKIAGRLPGPLGYGVSITHRTGVICIGGSNANRHFSDVFRLEWKANKLITTELPSLPKPFANACGALVGDTVYVAGGQAQPDAVDTLKTAYCMDLSANAPQWQEIDTWPGCGRMLAVAGGFDRAFWLVGGVELRVDREAKPERRYLTDAYRYNRESGWERIADLPYPVAAAPSPAPADEAGFYILGCDDGSQVGVPPDSHRGFSTKLLRYNARAHTWSEIGEVAATRVTAPCVFWNQSWVVPSGEIRPGVRSPDVWTWTPAGKD